MPAPGIVRDIAPPRTLSHLLTLEVTLEVCHLLRGSVVNGRLHLAELLLVHFHAVHVPLSRDNGVGGRLSSTCSVHGSQKMLPGSAPRTGSLSSTNTTLLCGAPRQKASKQQPSCAGSEASTNCCTRGSCVVNSNNRNEKRREKHELGERGFPSQCDRLDNSAIVPLAL